MVNPSTQLALEISEALLRVGSTDVVICPGSRSAALAWQFANLESVGQINLHTRIDEREAGFLALGIAKATKRPVAVVVTSGTAVANLLPSVVEAYHSGIPLVVLSADRPEVVRGKSAPQTTMQPDMFKNFVKAQVDISKPTPEILAALKLSLQDHAGPIHINAQFDLPLLPEDESAQKIEFKKEEIERVSKNGAKIALPAHGIVIVGDVAPGENVSKILNLAKQTGYPIIWEPTAQVHSSDNSLSHGSLLLQTGKTPKTEVVLTAGLVGLSRSVLALLKSTPMHVAIHLSDSGNDLPDPVQTANEILDDVPIVETNPDSNWLAKWKELDHLASQVVRSNLSSQTLTGPNVAVELWNKLPDDSNLFIAPSWPVRHLEMYAPTRKGITTFGNRGVNGIDGLISSAAGVALTKPGRTYLLIGDIAFLHGMGGLNVSAPNTNPNLTIVVVDNDGSGIFSQLEQGSPKYQKHFEQVFGTPHGKDLWVIAESLGVPAVRVTTKSELNQALERTNKVPGMHVIVCTTGNRQEEQSLISKILDEVTAVL